MTLLYHMDDNYEIIDNTLGNYSFFRYNRRNYEWGYLNK